jgi:capsular exopolysaccharide synthesis family protein
MREREAFSESEQINLKNILVKYFRYWYLFVVILFLCMGAAYLYLRYATPEYMISSTLLIKDDKKEPELLRGAVDSEFDVFRATKNINNEIVILKSKSLMQRVLEELAMFTSYYVEGPMDYVEIYGQSLPLHVIIDEIDSAALGKTVTVNIKSSTSFELQDENETQAYKFGQKIKKPYGTFTVLSTSNTSSSEHKTVFVKFNNLSKLADAYSYRLVVAPYSKEASIISIALVDPSPERGKNIVNKLVEVYNKEATEDRDALATSTIAFVNERLGYLTTELADVEKDVERYKRKNEVTDVSSEARLYLEKESDYNKQLAEWGIQIEVLESIEEYLNKEQNQFELVPSTMGIQDQTLLGLITSFNELQLERKRMLRTTQPNHPMVVSVDEQLINLRMNILENLSNIKRGLDITRRNLQASSAQFESKIRQVPVIERELLEINRQQSIKEGLYLYLLQKREESALSLVATVANSRLIDSAMVGEEPVKPKRMLIYVLAFLLGIGLPIAIIYIKDGFNDKVQQLKDIEEATATPILGEVSHKKAKGALVVTKESRSPVAEQFRHIRANMQFASAGQENKVILVTSSMGGEGKTFFSLNLGASLALAGKKVVVMGFDFRKPSLMQSIGLTNVEGITNYLVSDELPIEDIITPVEALPDLYVIGAGAVPINPSELILLSKVGKLINELKKTFDYIILDTSPVGQVADAFALAPYADSCIYLVRSKYTIKGQLNIINDIYTNQKFRRPMIVLNDSRSETNYGYGYGYIKEEKASTLGRFKEKSSV